MKGHVNSLGKDPEVLPFHVLIDLREPDSFRDTPHTVSLVRSAVATPLYARHGGP